MSGIQDSSSTNSISQEDNGQSLKRSQTYVGKAVVVVGLAVVVALVLTGVVDVAFGNGVEVTTSESVQGVAQLYFVLTFLLIAEIIYFGERSAFAMQC